MKIDQQQGQGAPGPMLETSGGIVFYQPAAGPAPAPPLVTTPPAPQPKPQQP